MKDYSEIRDDAFRMAHEEMMKTFSDADLLDAVELLKESSTESFGLIKGLRQKTVSNLFPLIADGSWRLKEAYYCSEESFDIIKKVPSFLHVESYKEWQRLREKYPKSFDIHPGGREALKEYNDKYPDFWGDAMMLDGHAEFRFGKITIAPNMVPERYKRVPHDTIQDDELFLIIYDYACREYPEVKCPYCSNCGTLQEHKGEINTHPGICYVLTPNKDDYDERRLELYKYFKSHIISAYLRLVMRKHDEDQIKILKNELMAKSSQLFLEKHLD